MPDETPNTIAYMIAGYAVLLGFPILYVISWFIRRRNLEKDIAMLESLKETEKQ